MQNIPFSVLRDLRCRHCLRFVSCGPVHVVPSEGSILCGRCRMLAKASYHNYAYETVAQLFLFPCHFWPKHCSRVLSWNGSLEHEYDCKYQGGCALFCSKPGVWCSSDRKFDETSTMDKTSFVHVPDQLLEYLKCVFCECYLSCDPVFITNEGRSVCHRCVTSNGQPSGCVRNLAYEKIATLLIFPCIFRFRGCPVTMPFGRAIWSHETECSYGVVAQKKKQKVVGANGKEKGVIQTHSGHIYATITSQSALFAPPPKNHRSGDGKVVTKELEERMKRKNGEEETRSFDDEASMLTEDGLSRASSVTKRSFDMDAISHTTNGTSASVGDNVSHVSRSTTGTFDNVSRSTQGTLDYSAYDESSWGPRLSSFRYQVANNGGYNNNNGRNSHQEMGYDSFFESNSDRNSNFNNFNHAATSAERAVHVHRTDSMIQELKLRQNLKKNSSPKPT